jgi:aspartate/methionine/tyrosine aminotransferase
MRLPDFALERYFARWEFTAELLLCASDLESWPLMDLLALADDDGLSRWGGLRLGYTESPGDPALRAEIAGLYEHVAPDDVLVFSGAEEAIFALHNVLLRPGDHAIVVQPAYQSLAEVAHAVGADVTGAELRAQDGWRLDVAAVRAALRPKSRLILVNEPHNPTGSLSDRATFDGLVALAAQSGARLIVDEVYRFLEFDPADRLPAGADALPNGVSIGVMSKAFGLAGLRIGWVATRDRELLARLAAFKDYTTICAAAPSEVLALIALRARDRVLARNRAIVATNMALLDTFFEHWAGIFEWVRPRGGSVAFPNLLANVPIDRFAEGLVRETGTLILPGSLFGDAENRFRIGFGRSSMPEALGRLDDFAARLFGGGGRFHPPQGAELARTDGASTPSASLPADMAAIEARLWAVIEPYRTALVPGSLYGMPTLTRPGAGAHHFFAGIRASQSSVSFHLKPLYDHPELLKAISPSLRRRLSGKQVLNFTRLDEAVFLELEVLTRRAFERYQDEGEQGC